MSSNHSAPYLLLFIAEDAFPFRLPQSSIVMKAFQVALLTECCGVRALSPFLPTDSVNACGNLFFIPSRGVRCNPPLPLCFRSFFLLLFRRAVLVTGFFSSLLVRLRTRGFSFSHLHKMIISLSPPRVLSPFADVAKTLARSGLFWKNGIDMVFFLLRDINIISKSSSH